MNLDNAPKGKLFELETPQEHHRRVVWGNNVCSYCDGRPVVACATIHLPDTRLAQMDPMGFAQGRYQRATQLDHAKLGAIYFYVATHYMCARCQKTVEVQLAQQLPSDAHVVFNRGISPDAKSAVISVPRNLEI